MTTSQPCQTGYIVWIYDVFADCIVTKKERTSFYIGLLSSVIWIISAFPQILTTYKIKKVEGISPFLFSCLFIADIMSLIGNLLTGGIASQILLAALYIVLDGTMYFQFLYYRSKNKTTHKQEDDEEKLESSSGNAAIILAATTAASIDWSKPYSGSNLVGTLFGWLSAIIYISSRIPQVRLNCKRKHVTDLSPFYFLCTISGNTTYLLSLFIRSTEGNFLWKQAPWITGVVVPLSCDIITAFQMCIYGFSVSPLFPIEKKEIEKNDPIDDDDDGRQISEF